MRIINTRLLTSPMNWVFVSIVFVFVMMVIHRFSPAKMETN